LKEELDVEVEGEGAVRGGTVHLERAKSPPMIFYVCTEFEAAEVNGDSPRKTRRGASPALALEY
jgi:hypothetical protein